MNDTQKFFLEFIRFFDGFCKENEIEYFLAGGSLLGAIRHRGFLPWDDDMDLYMKRSEWERAREIFAAKLPDRYKLVSCETDPDYHNTIPRIVDTRTSAFYRSRLADNTPHGVQLEFFLLDPMPDDPGEKERLYNDFWAFHEAENPYTLITGARIDLSRLSIESFRENVKMFDSGDTEAIEAKRMALRRWKASDATKYHEAWVTYWLEFPIEAFSKQIYVPFEDMMLPAPAGYADVLYGEYGDSWMELPSAANQAFHDDFEDYDIPYIHMQRDIDARLDVKEYKDSYKTRKRDLVEKMFLEHEIIQKRIAAEDKITAKHYNTANNKEDCRKAFERGDHRAVLDIMNEYITRQWDGFKANHIYALDRDLLYEVVYSCFMEGELTFADRIGRNLKDRSDKRLMDIIDDLPRLRRIRNSYYYGRLGEYDDLMEELLTKYPGQINLEMLKVQRRMDLGTEDPDRILEDVRELLSRHPGVHRLKKQEADLVASLGRMEEAEAMYRSILATSNDGIVNNEIRESGIIK